MNSKLCLKTYLIQFNFSPNLLGCLILANPKMLLRILEFTAKLLNISALSFYRSQNILSQSKNVIAFSASSKTLVPALKTKFTERKSSFDVAQNVWDWQKMCINVWSVIFKERFP